MEDVFTLLGGLSGFVGAALGAFGAHALRQRLSAEMLNVFEIGVRYQMHHAAALLAVAWLSTHKPGPITNASGWLFVLGTVVFSGSLYILSLTGKRRLGAITPLGGVALLGGWLCIMLAAITN